MPSATVQQKKSGKAPKLSFRSFDLHQLQQIDAHFDFTQKGTATMEFAQYEKSGFYVWRLDRKQCVPRNPIGSTSSGGFSVRISEKFSVTLICANFSS